MIPAARPITLPLKPALLALLLLAWLVPSLIGHDPWKTGDAVGVGIVHQMLAQGEWLVPHLAGEPYLDDGPLYYWIAALTAKLLSPFLAVADGARLASGLVMAATLEFVYLAARRLYGKLEGLSAVLVLLGCLGLLTHAHETLPEIGMLAGQALAWYGVALALRRPVSGGWVLGAGLGIAALCNGLAAVIAPAAVALAAPLLSSEWRRRKYALTLQAAALVFAALLGGWLALIQQYSPGIVRTWWYANTAQFARPPGYALAYWAQTLAWTTWPAWPLALWTLWEKRRRGFEPGTRMLIAAFVASAAVLAVLRDPREVYALPLLLPLALLGGAGVPSLRRGAANGLAWFGVMSAGFFGLLAWLGWFAMVTGVPAPIARDFVKLEPGYAPHFSWAAFVPALALTLAWLWLVLRAERSVLRSVTYWAAGITLLWGLVNTLLLSWIDYGRSYRAVALSLEKALPAGKHCIESRGLGESQRAVFDYHAEIVTEPAERHESGRCPLLLVQTRHGEPVRLEPGWKLMWEGQRPRDEERYRLYEKKP